MNKVRELHKNLLSKNVISVTVEDIAELRVEIEKERQRKEIESISKENTEKAHVLNCKLEVLYDKIAGLQKEFDIVKQERDDIYEALDMLDEMKARI